MYCLLHTSCGVSSSLTSRPKQDQATDFIVDAARRYGKPFALVPCCVFPSEFPERRLPSGETVVTYAQLLDYIAHTLAPSCASSPQGEEATAGRGGGGGGRERDGQETAGKGGLGPVATHYLPFRGRNKVLYCVSASQPVPPAPPPSAAPAAGPLLTCLSEPPRFTGS